MNLNELHGTVGNMEGGGAEGAKTRFFAIVAKPVLGRKSTFNSLF